MVKKGLLIVSFGTSHLDTLEKTIMVLEEEAAEQFQEYRVYRAFTSGKIIAKLKRTENMEIDTVEEAMERMADEGIEEVIIQPSHILNGIENEHLLRMIASKTTLFKKVSTGEPLLSSADDFIRSVKAVADAKIKSPNSMLVLIGHGTEHYANSAYLTLEYAFHSAGYKDVLVGTVESYPDIENILEKLAISGKKHVTLMPFLFVAGEHAKKDMAGGGDSWKTRLQKEGYTVSVVMKGLGEFKEIRSIFLEHIRNSKEISA